MLKKGFTLAEVLTTLMVIGVVAAMTIPTLMNSTNDQQLKVAYKKAMSVLGQGVQLMTAKEVQCTVNSPATLAKCFQENALSGTLTNHAGGNSGDLNTIVTSDGIAYQFYYNSTKSKLHGTENTSRTIEEICGDVPSLIQGNNPLADYNGTNAACAVFVDLNGLSKGAKEFKTPNPTTNGTFDQSKLSDEQDVIMITGTGVVPVYVSGNKNKGYKWMYGTAANPL